MAAGAKAGPGGSQELLPGNPHGCRPLRGIYIRVEQVGHKPIPSWDTGITGGSFVCHTTPDKL